MENKYNYFFRFSLTIQQWQFPDNFTFGVATSSYQIEGAWNEDGKSANIWDTFTHNRAHLITDESNADIACDSYHKWQEDIQLVKNLGVDFYRFSLSWSRIIPDGYSSNINQAGVDYYNKLIDGLIENGIEPMVTLFHWDLPQILGHLGGWGNELIVKYFAQYARIAFSLFGDRVKIWITINEPRLICQTFKGLVGDVVDPYPTGTVEYLCTRHVLLAHAEAYHIYDKEFRNKQKGEISISLDFSWTEPANKSDIADIKASNLWIQSEFGIYANPIFAYDYPQVVINSVAKRSNLEGFFTTRLPEFSLAEKLKIKDTYDFIGVNHYITLYGKPCEEQPIGAPDITLDAGGDCRFIDQEWERSGAPWLNVVPWGLRNLLNYIKETYNNPKIYITENGYSDNEEILEDDARINYYKVSINSTFFLLYLYR